MNPEEKLKELGIELPKPAYCENRSSFYPAGQLAELADRMSAKVQTGSPQHNRTGRATDFLLPLNSL